MARLTRVHLAIIILATLAAIAMFTSSRREGYPVDQVPGAGFPININRRYGGGMVLRSAGNPEAALREIKRQIKMQGDALKTYLQRARAAPNSLRFASGTGFDILTSDGGKKRSKEYHGIPAKFVQDVCLVAVLDKDWDAYKYKVLEIFVWHWKKKAIVRGTAYVFDTCTDAWCPDQDNDADCCTKNSSRIREMGAKRPFLLDFERNGSIREFGFDLMGKETMNPGIVVCAFRVKGKMSPAEYQKKYKFKSW